MKDIIDRFIEELDSAEEAIIQKRNPNYIVECMKECQKTFKLIMDDYDFVTDVLISPTDLTAEVNRLIEIESYVKENFIGSSDEGGDYRRWLYPRR